MNCEGRSSGLILLWNSEVDVQIQSYSRGYVDSLVRGPDSVLWHFTGFCGNPVRSERHHSWSLIRRLHELFFIPWVIGGDFNEIFYFYENSAGSDRPYASMDDFWEVMEECSLFALGFEGPAFTWDKGMDEDWNVQEQLDHYVGSDD